MSSARVFTGGLSERPTLLDSRQRDAMEAGIDLHAAAMVEEVLLPAPPTLRVGPDVPADRRTDSDESAAQPPPLPDVEVADSQSSRLSELVAVVDAEPAESPNDMGVLSEAWTWMKDNVHWYAISFAIHIGLFAALLLILGRIRLATDDDAATFVPVDDDLAYRRRLNSFDFPDGAPEQPTELNASVLRMPEIRSAPAEFNDNSPVFRKEGGGRTSDSDTADFGGNGGFRVRHDGPGPLVNGDGGLGAEHGTSDRLGSGGSRDGFAGRGKGNRQRLIGLGAGTKDTEVAVAAALNWFSRHRNPNGSWSLSRFSSHCTGNPCTAPGTADSDTAATALAVLPFLGAGETHKSKGPYQDAVKQGLYFLMRRQTPNGDLSAGTGHQMYAHALATLALCEAYGMTKDPKVGDAAQRAVMFIEAAQNRATGGWRYVPGDPTGGDTSVLGWQIMALRSGQLAGLAVNSMTMENAKKWLASVSKGYQHGLYAYQPYKEATPTMTAIGMLSWQYLGMRPDDPAMLEGKYYLMQHLPDNGERNTYYWYYATQAMHNMIGPNWDSWNRKMRKALVESQCREGCASGSWDPTIPTQDSWSEQGGRIVTTAFSTLSLEVYYRYLPLYNLHGSASDPPPPVVVPQEDEP
jgi:hypothetical protein